MADALNPTHCRRPYCATLFTSTEARDKHEADATKHRKRDMDFICDWEGHYEAISEHNFCPVCQ